MWCLADATWRVRALGEILALCLTNGLTTSFEDGGDISHTIGNSQCREIYLCAISLLGSFEFRVWVSFRPRVLKRRVSYRSGVWCPWAPGAVSVSDIHLRAWKRVTGIARTFGQFGPYIVPLTSVLKAWSSTLLCPALGMCSAEQACTRCKMSRGTTAGLSVLNCMQSAQREAEVIALYRVAEDRKLWCRTRPLCSNDVWLRPASSKVR